MIRRLDVVLSPGLSSMFGVSVPPGDRYDKISRATGRSRLSSTGPMIGRRPRTRSSPRMAIEHSLRKQSILEHSQTSWLCGVARKTDDRQELTCPFRTVNSAMVETNYFCGRREWFQCVDTSSHLASSIHCSICSSTPAIQCTLHACMVTAKLPSHIDAFVNL